MNIEQTKLKDCYIILPKVFNDNRGYFYESYSKKSFEDAGFYYDFVQDNHSYSKNKNTIRGLHFQTNLFAQAKLVRCTKGAIYDVAVDLRKDSLTYKQYIAVLLSSDNYKQLLIPRGFAHGFLSLTNDVEIQYKADNYYSPENDSGIIYSDPEINVGWKGLGLTSNPILSEKDSKRLVLKKTKVDF